MLVEQLHVYWALVSNSKIHYLIVDANVQFNHILYSHVNKDWFKIVRHHKNVCSHLQRYCLSIMKLMSQMELLMLCYIPYIMHEIQFLPNAVGKDYLEIERCLNLPMLWLFKIANRRSTVCAPHRQAMFFKSVKPLCHKERTNTKNYSFYNVHCMCWVA